MSVDDISPDFPQAPDDGGGAAGGLLQAGIGFATGNPLAALSGAASLFGIGMSLFGTEEATKAAEGEAQTSQNIAALQIQENTVRQQAMEMAARRQNIEVARQTQLASARSLQASVSQGAGTQGSGLAGGQAQASTEGAFQTAGINTNLQLGRQMFGLDSSIDQQKIIMAQYQSQQASGQGLQALGSGIGSAGMNFMKMFSG